MSRVPTILFGAFDRHNFGDLLFPHIASAMLEGENLLFSGLADRDMRRYGGHQVSGLAQLSRRWGRRRVNLFHVGGELLTCDAWEAAVMLLAPHQAQSTIARLNAQPQERMEWARTLLGISCLAPYTLARQLFPGADRVIYNAVGGTELNQRDPAMRAEVLAKLVAAEIVSVRDNQTHALLHAAGIAARLMPDPAVMVAHLFGARIRQRAEHRPMAELLAAFHKGYVAAQFSADFGDGATLTEIAAQLDEIASSTGCGVVFFCAGAAPWHDDQALYRCVAARMRSPSVRTFPSLNLWDICALIAHSRIYVGSSLHGRIVAMAFALPRMNLRHPAQTALCSKQEAFAATWEKAGTPGTVALHEIGSAVRHALAADPVQLQQTAMELVKHYRRGFEEIRAGLK
jgi:hypothetical protein